MERDKLLAAVLAASGAFGTSGAVYAWNGRGSASGGTAMFVGAEVTVAQAIAIAEQHLGGEAIGTGSYDAGGRRIFYVEVLKYGQKRMVMVDLQSGRVINDAMAGDNGI